MSGASCGHILPCALYQSQFHGNSCHFRRRPCLAAAASRTRTPSGMTSRPLPVIGVSAFEAIAQESGAARVVACIDARMREVYYAALEKHGGRWREVVPGQCIAPGAAAVPAGDGWIGCGSGFGAFPALLQNKIKLVRPEIHPTALAVAQLAAPRLVAGEGVDAVLATPLYPRDQVAFTTQE